VSEDAKATLLLVDDDEVLCRRLARALEQRGYAVTVAFDAEQARELARADPPEYAVVDLRLGDARGLDVVRQLLEIERATRVIVLTGYGSIASAVEAMRLGAVHYLTKPADADEVALALQGSTPENLADAVTPSLARAEWEHIQRVLADVAGNVSEAARRLGLHRRSLQRKLGKLPPRR
jgi:two-component system response regulator RegA